MFDVGKLNLDNKCIMITGGTGSFGRQFLHTILKHTNVKRIVIYSRDEHKQYDLAQTLDGAESRVRMFIGDVRDRDRMAMAMRGVDIVIHAAALKHVPAAEYNPFECIHTNVIGAENVVQCAINNNVSQVLALSTDKAASPANLYGASKLASDKIMVAANNLAPKNGPRFSVVRYGNVFGSRGSVVPFFQKLVKEGATTLPITDERMTRFWISLQEGVDFVLSCLKIMRGGEIFIPKIPSMKITDLATTIGPELPHEVVGIRPGEKLHEVMITEDDSRNTWELPDRFVIEPEFNVWESVRSQLEGAVKVEPGFVYSSNSNKEWLKSEDILDILEKARD